MDIISPKKKSIQRGFSENKPIRSSPAVRKENSMLEANLELAPEIPETEVAIYFYQKVRQGGLCSLQLVFMLLTKEEKQFLYIRMLFLFFFLLFIYILL